MSEAIVTFEIELIQVSDDAGPVYEIICPECKGKVRWASFGWWDMECECGRTWSIEIQAIGRK